MTRRSILLMLSVTVSLTGWANAQQPKGGPKFLDRLFGRQRQQQESQKKVNEVAGEDLTLTDQHGPYMIRAASFIEDQFPDMPATEVAAALAKEIRQTLGIPAYVHTFVPDSAVDTASEEEAAEFKRKFNVPMPRKRTLAKPKTNYVVLAGNFPSEDDKVARKSLEKMKSYVPKDAQRLLRGSIALFKEDKAAFKPFGSAMLIRNPLMPSQGSDINNQISPELATMLLKLNDDEPYSIYKNQKPLTLLVKQFTGATNTTGRDAEDKKLAGALADGKHFRGDLSVLSEAGRNANLVTQQLRKLGYDAYVFHGRLASLVFMNGYANDKDPAIAKDTETVSKIRLGQLKLDQAKIMPAPKRPPGPPSVRVMAQ